MAEWADEMSDLTNCLAAIAEAERGGREIDHATARTIAAMYHEGQSSISYSFVSTGVILDRTKLWRELFPNFSELSSGEQTCANWLGTYILNRKHTGPVKNWAKKWVCKYDFK